MEHANPVHTSAAVEAGFGLTLVNLFVAVRSRPSSKAVARVTTRLLSYKIFEYDYQPKYLEKYKL